MIQQARKYFVGAMSGATLIGIAIAVFVVLVSAQVFHDFPLGALVGHSDNDAVAPAKALATGEAGAGANAATGGTLGKANPGATATAVPAAAKTTHKAASRHATGNRTAANPAATADEVGGVPIAESTSSSSSGTETSSSPSGSTSSLRLDWLDHLLALRLHLLVSDRFGRPEDDHREDAGDRSRIRTGGIDSRTPRRSCGRSRQRHGRHRQRSHRRDADGNRRRRHRRNGRRRRRRARNRWSAKPSTGSAKRSAACSAARSPNRPARPAPRLIVTMPPMAEQVQSGAVARDSVADSVVLPIGSRVNEARAPGGRRLRRGRGRRSLRHPRLHLRRGRSARPRPRLPRGLRAPRRRRRDPLRQQGLPGHRRLQAVRRGGALGRRRLRR